MFNDYQRERKSGNGKQTFFIILSLLILGLIVWAVWHFNSNNNENITTTETVLPLADSARIKDSMAIYAPLNDTNKMYKNASDGYTFKVVVNEFTNKQAALSRLESLQTYNRNVIMYTNDSITYKIAEPFTLPLSDTTRVLDSLKRYYPKSKTHLEY